MHRIATPDGRNAIMVVPEIEGDRDLRYSTEEMPVEETTLIEFRRVDGGEHLPDSYLTLDYPERDMTLHLGPYIPLQRKTN